MIYERPATEERVDQGDLLDECPILHIEEFRLNQSTPIDVGIGFRRVVVVTQTCDLTNDKTTAVNIAEVIDAQEMVDQKILKPADIKGPLRAGRVWGLYFLPAFVELGLREMIVDLRRVHTIRLDLLATLCREGKRVARIQTPTGSI